MYALFTKGTLERLLVDYPFLTEELATQLLNLGFVRVERRSSRLYVMESQTHYLELPFYIRKAVKTLTNVELPYPIRLYPDAEGIVYHTVSDESDEETEILLRECFGDHYRPTPLEDSIMLQIREHLEEGIGSLKHTGLRSTNIEIELITHIRKLLRGE